MKKDVFSLCLIVFISFLGLSMSQPLLTAYILSIPQDPYIYIKLSIILAAFPVTQFFSLPYLGYLSDTLCRKKVLLCSFSINCILHLCMALAIFKQSLLCLFLLRVLSGMIDANIAVARAALYDLATEKNMAKYNGYLNAAMQSGYIGGPLLVSMLLFGASSIISFQTAFGTHPYSYAFMIMSGFYALCVLFLLCNVKTTTAAIKKVQPLPFMASLKDLWQHDKTRRTFTITLFSVLPVDLLYQTFPVILMRFKNIDAAQMPLYISMIAGANLFMNLCVVGLLHHRVSKSQIIQYSLCSMILCLMGLLFIQTNWLLVCFTALLGCCIALVSSTSVMFIHDLKSSQAGKNMGVYISTRLLNGAILSMISGVLISLSISPLIMAIGSCFCALILWHKSRAAQWLKPLDRIEFSP